MAARQVRFGHYLAYGSNDFLGAGAMSIISAWILFFYTTFCGLTAGAGRRSSSSSRGCSMRSSRPLIGYISDHFHRTWLGRKFGRRRFFILLAIPLLPSFALMWVEGQSFWYYLVTYVLLRARVRDGDHPVRNAGRGDVARLPDQGQVRRRAHPVRADRQHRGAVAAGRDHRPSRRQGLGRHLPLSRRHLLRVLRAGRARGLPVHLGTPARARSRTHRPSARRARRSQASTQLIRRSVARRCASARSACTSACTSAATSARTSSMPVFVVLHRIRARGHGGHHVEHQHLAWPSRSCSRCSSPSGLVLRIHPAPSYRIARRLVRAPAWSACWRCTSAA